MVFLFKNVNNFIKENYRLKEFRFLIKKSDYSFLLEDTILIVYALNKNFAIKKANNYLKQL